jgi:hypothetical protein
MIEVPYSAKLLEKIQSFSVAKGPKFRPQITKKIVLGRKNLRPNFWQIYQKRAEKGPNIF